MEQIQETFLQFDPMLQVLWIIAAIVSAVFAVMAITTFMGYDADANIDLDPEAIAGGNSDFDVEGFHLVSIKSITAFLLGFSWTGVLFWDHVENKMLLSAICLAVGFLFMSIIAYMLYKIQDLDRDNTFDIRRVVGLNADCYLRIPAGRKATGKITVSLNGSLHELEALSDENIPTGAKVKIVSLINDRVPLVEML